ncbi:MAG: hypothetical protein LAN84_06670 [Acidobacteriia bacterium]|nr:hypothetical protein [Terriglobia bacterium]
MARDLSFIGRPHEYEPRRVFSLTGADWQDRVNFDRLRKERLARAKEQMEIHDLGDEGHRKGWCLYKMGCKGPVGTFNCPNARWNDQTSWPVKAGHGCLACASPRFWDTKSPFYERLPSVPGFGVDVTAGEIGLVLTGAVAGATIVHGIASAVRDRRRGSAAPPPETPSSEKTTSGKP